MINYRALIITSFILIVFIALIAKLFSIQISKNEYYSLKAIEQQNKRQVVKAERGLIKDINGEVLSFTKDNVSFYADKRMMDAPKVDSIAALFSKVIGKNKNYYKNLIEVGERNVCLEKKVPMNKAIELKKAVIEGLFYEEDFSRIYPYGSLASHVLGYVNKELKGVEGVEKVYDAKLTGIDGNYIFERDVRGRIITINDQSSRVPISGNNITLTINKTYQKILTEELARGLQKFNGESAVGIIMNPNNGEILALTNLPDFDPLNYEVFPADSRRNRAITDTYEPGSTMKSIVMSMLIDQKLVKENEVIDTENGSFVFKSTKISDTRPHKNLTVREVIEQSSNIGMTKISTRIFDDMFYKYLRDFGFSNPTSIDLPGEAEGYLKKPADFTAISKPFISFGYEISVTPLQIITAFSALVNGGILYKPYLLKAITDNQGKIIEETKPQKIRTVIDKSTSDLIKDFMIGVVEQGTGTAAQLDNVLVGGKTGTSQLLEYSGYSKKRHNSSFIGFFPADNPKLICLVLINAPEIAKYGSLVAAPIFRDIAKRIVETDLEIIPYKKKIERNKNLIEQLIADIKSAPNSTSKSYLNLPKNPGENISQKKIISSNRATMPNLVNRAMRDAIGQLIELGLEYKVAGSGKVISQSIEPGTVIEPGAFCIIKCEPSKKLNSVRIN